MSFASPLFLLGLLLVPLAVAAYVSARRRSKRYAVRFTAAPTLKLAAGTIPAWRTHLPAAAALAALAVLTLALAKPERTVEVPSERATIMLVTDHSRSMLATDVDPNRLTAAKKAADTFIDQLPARIPLGIVAYSGAPDAVQAPSRDHDDTRQIIEAQEADGATATGDALLAATEALLRGRSAVEKRPPAAIVLLSDGQTSGGRDPVVVARSARRLKIPIFTVSLGTDAATVPGPQYGTRLPAVPDPETLREIAEVSGGKAFSAEDDEELSSIYKALGSQLGTRKERREVTSAFAIGGLALLLAAAAASIRWSGRLP